MAGCSYTHNYLTFSGDAAWGFIMDAIRDMLDEVLDPTIGTSRRIREEQAQTEAEPVTCTELVSALEPGLVVVLVLVLAGVMVLVL